MFCREPRIPINKLVEAPSSVRHKPMDQYVAQHRQKLLLAHLNAYQKNKKMIRQKQAQSEKKKPILEKLEFGDAVRKRFQSSGRRKLTNLCNTEKFVVVNVKNQVDTKVSNTESKQQHINRCNLQKIGSEMEELPKFELSEDSDSE